MFQSERYLGHKTDSYNGLGMGGERGSIKDNGQVA